MIPAPFDYYAPNSLAEALTLLQQHGDDAKILAGGHSLLPAMKLRLASPAVLIDINKVSELRGIKVNGTVEIGALTTWSAIEQDAALAKACPVMAEAVSLIGDIQVRNRGTIGGSLAHADPAADMPAVVLALDAHIHLEGPNGPRAIAAADFFTDMLSTALEPGEIITSITFNSLGPGEGAAYAKFPHPASRYAIVGAAAYVKMENGQITACRVAITGAGPKAERQPAVEQALIGTDGSADAIAAAAAHAGEGMDMLGDIHASEEYRRAMCKVYAKRALLKAVERAR
jgi:carbon-monoxide dehydrogenase medium subunit